MITAIAKPLGMLLNVLYSVVGNYGITIILFTLVIKLFLLPLTFKQLKSTSKMTEIQPEIKRIQEKYKNDKEKLNQKTMELYQKHKVNPVAGCLPLLIQMPILFGLFAVLRNPGTYAGAAIEAASMEPFLWMSSLKEPDLWILPIAAAITTYFSIKSSSGANSQAAENQTMKTMNMIMPIMILFWGRGFPAGLCLYWVVSNLFQMVQQMVMPKPGTSKEELS
ncbi:MAG: YidC/Oxa1 family membrane protein insertase [Anaeromicrobium sp.]|jgi:YidC/Oxa1 family membrane protein insertase|uniref:YidC/Oxa1 family membrane protein insertase n=1 Tax=Anaeromicrobium sp. TaxID=1929132 RepID=UPI0025DCB5FB|nr:YidC/Oxa1 family membrane protein insertase [Anaeromicrobium sp.]MCT4594660.1 YidC/Oxa1 family membrane protein insertase [Anaeromicrobium sp.]